jgi:hypothetical protein
MKRKQLNYLLSRLNHFDLTKCEKRYLKLLISHLMLGRELTVEQETILSGLYKEKVRWAKLGLIKEKRTERRQ